MTKPIKEITAELRRLLRDFKRKQAGMSAGADVAGIMLDRAAREHLPRLLLEIERLTAELESK
jgi:hypothetical protein